MRRTKAAVKLMPASVHLRQIVEHLPIGTVFVDGESIMLNPAAEQITGYSTHELPTLDAWFTVMYGAQAEAVRALYEHQRSEGFVESAVVPLTHRNGSARRVQFTGMRDDSGEAWLLYDITEQKATEEALRGSEERYALAMEGSQDGLWDWDIRSGNVFFSARWKSMVGYAPDELADHVDTWKLLLHPDDQVRVFQTLQDYFAQRISLYEIEFRFLHKDGSYRWILARGVALFDVDRQPYRMAGSHTDITERKALDAQVRQNLELISRQNATLEAQKGELQQALAGMAAANARLETLATTDGLTGLTNHRTFQERLAEAFAHSRRSHRPLSVALLDVDKFKHYNDAFGHQAGDQVLKQVAEILRATVREADVAARYGGEEFVVLLPNTNADTARNAAERLREAVQAALWTQRAVTVSIGVATRRSDMALGSQLVAAADKALYCSKQRGRNRVTHAADMEEALLPGDSTLEPYTALLQEMLQAQQDSLLSASERIRYVMAQTYDATIESWARLLDLRDKETEGHSARVTEMMLHLGKSIGLNPEEIMYARWGALLHDIGKMGVPDQVLLKPGPLTESEWDLMRRHTTLAYEMLWPIEFLRPAIDIPFCHHEKWDGSGYPRGLRGDDIPLTARLFAVIDVYDALRSDRPYRAGWEKERVCAYLQEQAGTHFDPRAVKAFLKMLAEQNEKEPQPMLRAA